MSSQGTSGLTAVSESFVSKYYYWSKYLTASKSSEKFNEILRDYHKRSTNRVRAAELLFRDYGLIVRCARYRSNLNDEY